MLSSIAVRLLIRENLLSLWIGSKIQELLTTSSIQHYCYLTVLSSGNLFFIYLIYFSQGFCRFLARQLVSFRIETPERLQIVIDKWFTLANSSNRCVIWFGMFWKIIIPPKYVDNLFENFSSPDICLARTLAKRACARTCQMLPILTERKEMAASSTGIRVGAWSKRGVQELETSK